MGILLVYDVTEEKSCVLVASPLPPACAPAPPASFRARCSPGVLLTRNLQLREHQHMDDCHQAARLRLGEQGAVHFSRRTSTVVLLSPHATTGVIASQLPTKVLLGNKADSSGLMVSKKVITTARGQARLVEQP